MKSCESSQNCHQGNNCHIDHECETESGPEPGRPCVFPFMYKGVTYNECTSVEWDQPWCAVVVDNNQIHIKGKWGNCKKTCNTGREVCPSKTYCHIDDEVCLPPCESDKNCAGGYKCSNGHCLKPCTDDHHCSNNDQYCHK